MHQCSAGSRLRFLGLDSFLFILWDFCFWKLSVFYQFGELLAIISPSSISWTFCFSLQGIQLDIWSAFSLMTPLSTCLHPYFLSFCFSVLYSVKFPQIVQSLYLYIICHWTFLNFFNCEYYITVRFSNLLDHFIVLIHIFYPSLNFKHINHICISYLYAIFISYWYKLISEIFSGLIFLWFVSTSSLSWWFIPLCVCVF